MGGKIGVESEFGIGSKFFFNARFKVIDETPIGKNIAESLMQMRFAEKSKKTDVLVFEPMPYGKVLVTDDVFTNLEVAKGLMKPYGLEVSTASSGREALEIVEKNKSGFDIIFMDHMMPEMDGIETVEIMRGMGYKGIIVALTANAVLGADKIFKEAGFDDFISKPINTEILDDMLKKYIRDKQPAHVLAEAAKIKPQIVEESEKICGIPVKVAEMFRKDAAKAIAVLKETAAKGDLKSLVITAHAMKSALANIGEAEISSLAKELEFAGREDNSYLLEEKTPVFIEKLDEIIAKLTPISTKENVEEDTRLVKEKAKAICAACDDFDSPLINEILKELENFSLKPETKKTLSEISENILFSDFDAAKVKAEKLSN
jgi:CheY-like chemotaxis protein/HPt (histidine-containing phosphotransfer) domain-containing protein